MDWLKLALVLGALSLVVAIRFFSWPAVSRQGHVVFLGKDPYFYRYWVEQLQALRNVGPTTVPGRVIQGEPLLVGPSDWLR